MKPKDLAKIESSTSPYSVSQFIRTEKPYPERKDFENHIHRILGRLETCLDESGCPEETKQERLKAVKQELSTLDHKDLLKGIALFVNEHIRHLFKLPVETRDAVVIDDLFVIRELLLSANKTYHYWLLTLSEPVIHLYHGKEDELNEYTEGEFPLEHLVQEAPLERTLSSSVASAGGHSHSSAGRSAGSTHLPGDYAADQDSYKEEHLKQFFRTADGALSNVLEEHPYPLILAGTERNLASFKEISKHHQNAAGFLNGSFNKTSLAELRELATPVIEKHLSGRCACVLEEFQEALGHKKTAQGIQEVWQTVQEGRCKVLMLERDFYSFAGTAEGEMSLDLSVDRSRSSSDCFVPDNLEALIRKTRRMGGEIAFFEPDKLKLYDRVAAILRY